MAEKSVKSSVARNTLIVLAFSMLSKLLSLVRESTIAAYAGTGIEADAYYIVQSLFMILELGLSTSIFQSFFPIYRKMTVEAQDEKRQTRFTNAAFTLLVIFAAVLAILELLGRDLLVGLLAPGFDAETRSLANYLVLFSAPMLVFVVAAECVSAVLRAHNRFANSQVRETATHVAAIILVILFYRQNGVQTLGISMLAGSVLRLLIQLPALRKVHKLRLCFDFKSADVREMLRRIPAILISTSSTQIKSMIDKMMASMLASGTVASLNYGHKLESALGGLLSTAMATGMYPEMVKLFVNGEKEKLSRMLYKSIQIFALIVVPVCIGGCFVGDTVVSIVYERGAFGAEAVKATAAVFVAYLLGTFFHGTSSILSNIFYSAGNTRTPMIINCIDLVLKMVLNLVMMKLMGAVGLALATSFSTIIVCALRFVLLRKYLVLPERSFWLELLRFAASSLVAGVVSVTAIRWLGIESRVLFLIGVVAVFAVIYVALLLATKSSSVHDALNMVKRKLHRGAKSK